MKKVLFASTALVAFGLAGAAQAADPIALKLGGYTKYVFGYADNDIANRADTDVKGSNEVFFLGSTTLDNGIKIGVDMQLEAGGTNNSSGANGTAVAGNLDPIDEAYITVDGGFGRVILGSENNGAYLLHVSAPNAAGDWEETEFGILTGQWISAPGGFAGTQSTTAINTDQDAEKITYVAPSFAGFTVGASYIPNIESTGTTAVGTILNSGDIVGMPADTGTISHVWGVGGAYNNSFGGVGLKLSAGFVRAEEEIDHREWSAGAQIGFAGFTVGAAFRDLNSDLAVDGQTWTAGVQYATGPFAVSVGYFASESDTTGDELNAYQVSGKYNMGPGVDWIASIGHADYDNAVSAGVAGDAGVDNDGWAAYTGLALAF